MGKLNSLGNRIVALALCLILVISMLPSGAIAEGNGNDVVLGTVEALTNGTVTGNGTANVKVEVKDATLQWFAADESIGRYQDGYWAGINVTAPAGFSANATYKMATKEGAEFGEAKSFTANKDTEDTIGLWMPISAESLSKFASEGRKLTLVYAFDWNADGDYEQTIVFAVDPTSIVLQKNGVQVYPFGTVEALTNGTVTGNGTGNVEVLIKDATLQWFAADESIGRYQDGYWAGINVTAPAGFSENATYKMATKVGAEFGEAKSFAANKDTEDTIGLWMPITAESLDKFISETRNLTLVYAFDWDADGDYEQTIIFAVDPNTITLEENGVQVYPPLGTVETLTNGTVTGNGTGNVEVLIKDATLQWFAADESIGRYQDGYWAGINVTAPAGFSANATYKMATKVGAEFGETKKFADNRDTDTTIGLWMPISAESLDKFISEGRNLTLVYAFDWNADGDYEQTIIFAVDPNTITLEENGVQVYPPLGTVETLTNGTVTGNGTGNVEVLIKDATLQWFAADESIGRYQDGYWAGINVTAPAGFSENATYKMATKVGAEFGEAKSFAANKDTDTTIGLWMPITAESLDKFISETRNLTLVYAFDWNADGDYEQTIIFAVDPNTITLEENGVQVYPPLGTVETLTGGTITGNATSEVTVVIDEVVLNWSEADDSIGRAQGWWVGINVIAPEGFSAEATYKIKTGPNVDFGEAKKFVEFKDGEKNIQLWFPVSPESLAKFKAENRDLVMTYAFDWNNDSDYEQTIIFSVVPSEKIVLNTKEWKPFNFEKDADEITYAPELTYTNTLVGKDETVVFGIVDEKYEGVDADVADIDAATGKLTIKQAGTVTVRATREADKWYDEATAEYTLTVNKADQTIAFNTVNEEDVLTYTPDLLDLPGITGKLSGEDVDIVYTITSGNDVATIENGKLELLKAGEFEMTVCVPTDVCYNESNTLTWKVTVEKADQTFVDAGAFAQDVSLTYGAIDFTKTVELSVPNSGNPVVYTGNNDTLATVDAATGKVTFKDNQVGEIIVTASVAGDDCYNAASIEYTITVAYLDDATMPSVENKWYTEAEITVSAPEGYTVSKTGKLVDAEWSNEVTFTAIDGLVDSDSNSVNVYLRNADGHITDVKTISGIKIDTKDPIDLSISYAFETEADIGGKHYVFSKEQVVVTVTASDETSGIATIAYSLNGGDSYTVITAYEGEYKFAVDPYYCGQLMIKATDEAGNNITFKKMKDDTDEILVVDSVAPGLTVGYTGGMTVEPVDGTLFVKNDKVTVVFEITDEMFDLRANDPIVTVNGEPKTEWEFDETSGKLIFELTAEGDYTIEASFTDRLNRAVTYESEVRIDRTKPTIKSTIENGKYYAENQEFVLTITEHNFDAQKVELNVEAVDSKGVSVLTAEDIQAFADLAWVQDAENPDVYTLTLSITKDGNYTVTVNCSDKLDQAADTHTKVFTVDKVKPNQPTFKYEVSSNNESLIYETIGGVNYGFAKETVLVTVQAEDATSGPAYIELVILPAGPAGATTLTMPENLRVYADGTIEGNKGFIGDINVVVAEGKMTVTFEIPAQFRGTLNATVCDKAGWTEEKVEETVIVVDDSIGLKHDEIFTNDQVREYNNIFYTQGETKVKFTITEANFDLSVAPVLTVNTVAQDITWTQIDGTDDWETEITLSGNGDYVIALSYTDRSTNAMETYTKEIHIDDVAPVFDVTYDNNKALNENNYKANRTATIKITEHNFKPDEVKLTVTATDVTGAKVDISSKGYAGYAKDPANWKRSGDVWTLNTAGMKFDIEAKYSVKLEYTDLAENDAETYTTEFVVDKTAPENIQIKYSKSVVDKILETVTFGFYKSKVKVTLTADDITSGVDYFTWTYTKEEGSSDKNMDDVTKVITTENITYSNGGKTATATFVIEAQARGYISVDVTDMAGNTSGEADDTRINVVDTIAPTREVSYKPKRVLDAETLMDVETFAEGDNVILYYEKEAVVTFTIDEANFYAEGVLIKVNGKKVVPTDWTQSGDIWTGTITISGDGDYVVTMTYKDRSTNKMVSYKSQKIAIDDTDPTIKVEYNNNTALNNNNYKKDRTATITIVDHNFRADDVTVTVTAKDIQGNAVEVTDFDAYLKNRDSWTTKGDTHVAKITYSTDAIYTFTISYADIIGNKAEKYAKETFVVDHKKPTDLKIEYSESVVDKILGAITFGFYKPEVKVTLTADDITSGVDYFEWTYTKGKNTSDKNTASYGDKIEAITFSNDGKTAIATFTIPANARGYISASVTDKAGNTAKTSDKKNTTIIVDDIAPEIKVEYDAGDAAVQYVNKKMVTVDSFKKATNAYFNGNVTAKIVITEANFFEGVKDDEGNVIHNVGIKLTKTDNDGNVTVYEYLPEGAEQKYTDAKTKKITWSTSGDEHTLDIEFKDNADYVLEIEYTDLSKNNASISANDGKTATKTYKSKVITVDKIAPKVSVEYSNEDVIYTGKNGREYFDAVQTATITVKEHNFRADDFVATITAKDLLGNDVTKANVAKFVETLADDSKWTKDGNTYTIKLKYSVDANYTFDFKYQDLALNKTANYKKDLFTVDKTAPKLLDIVYDQNYVENTSSDSVKYYDGVMKVTLKATDNISGVNMIKYSYLLADEVSSVNAQKENVTVTPKQIAGTTDFEVTFTIPLKKLTAATQFNGSVKFTAYDKSENSTLEDHAEEVRVVVDNIPPKAQIGYNNPVQTTNGISYYAGDINATIVITEANFDKDDVVVTVTKNGAAFPVNVAWVDENVDTHIGTFTLTGDGDYIVSVQYTDKSGNKMDDYTSNQLTLDTTKPTVEVSNIKANSANKDETYGFVITVNDTNLDVSTFKPVLKAILQKEGGELEEIDLGEAKTIVNGKTYSYTVENLPKDGLYTLTCNVADMSANGMSQVVLEDGQSYEQVQFSINRNGSAFGYGNKTLEGIVAQHYIYSVREDVVIVEVNVDPIETYKVTLNGKELVEGTDYTTTQTSKEGEWSKRTYTINKSNFEAEGEYNIIVSSTDKADTTAFSDIKDLSVAFVVDQTKPVLTITGLEGGGRYQTEAQTVTLIPSDEGGRLNSLTVLVMDSDGNPLKDKETGEDISVRFDKSGEDLLQYLEENAGIVTFTIPDGLNNQVKVICSDCAMDAENLTNEYNELFEKVTVSPNAFVIFYANTPLFVGSIVGVLAVIALIIFLIKRKGGKKDKAKA